MGHIHGPLFGFQVHAQVLVILNDLYCPCPTFCPPPKKISHLLFREAILTPKDISVIVLDFTGGVNWT
jgi:hypothetical protein